MKGNLPPQEPSAEMTYGHYLEPVLLKWFADQHPELHVTPGRWMSAYGWAGATPDGLFTEAETMRTGLVQCKTARQSWEWADGVPIGYRDQVQWEMWVAGEDVCYVVADVAMEFREYIVERDDERIAYLIEAGRAFMDSLAADAPPEINDGSTATYEAIRYLHPDINGEDVEIPTPLAVTWLTAKRSAALWAEKEAAAKNRIAGILGDGKRARHGKHTLFGRQSKSGGTPYLVAGRSLPHPKDL